MTEQLPDPTPTDELPPPNPTDPLPDAELGPHQPAPADVPNGDPVP